MSILQKNSGNQLFKTKLLQLRKLLLVAGMLLGMTTVGVAQTLVGTATANVTTYGAIGDGSTDNVTYLQNAINAVPSGGSLIIPTGNYVSSGRLTITRPITIIGQGFQTTILNFVNTAGLEISSSDVKIKDIRIYHTNTNGVKYIGVDVDNGNQIDNFNLQNVDISRFSTALKINKLWNFNFTGLSLSFVGDIGIHSTGLSVNNQLDGVRICSATLNVSGSKGIFFDGTSGPSEGWSINNSLIFGFETLIDAQAMCHVYISNSILDYAGQRGILLESYGANVSGGWQISNNYIAVNNGIAGIHDGNTAAQSNIAYGNIFANNKILSYVSGNYGIVCDNNSCNNIISGNRISNFTSYDISANSVGGNNIITNNLCLSAIASNIYGTGLIADNIGTVYYQRSINFSMIGKIKCSYDEALPTIGSWKTGDIVWKVNPIETGSTGSKYILHGWRRLTTGTANVLNVDWAEMRMLTGR